jgi:hypothetical protein
MYISLYQVLALLDAIYWMISPYDYYNSWDEYPFVRTLANTYNKMIDTLDSQGLSHNHSHFIIK